MQGPMYASIVEGLQCSFSIKCFVTLEIIFFVVHSHPECIAAIILVSGE